MAHIDNNGFGLGITTAARTRLSLVHAGIGSRATAYLADWLILLLVWLFVLFIMVFSEMIEAVFSNIEGGTFNVTVIIFSILFFYFGNWLYFVVFETLWHGQTPGKRMVGLRITTDNGLPVGFSHAVIRTTMRIIDFLPVFYAIGLTSALLQKRGKRLGDLVAGTVLVREHTDALYIDEPELAPEAELRILSREAKDCASAMKDEDYNLVRSYLVRRLQMSGEARRERSRAVLAAICGRNTHFSNASKAYTPQYHPEALLEDIWRAVIANQRRST